MKAQILEDGEKSWTFIALQWCAPERAVERQKTGQLSLRTLKWTVVLYCGPGILENISQCVENLKLCIFHTEETLLYLPIKASERQCVLVTEQWIMNLQQPHSNPGSSDTSSLCGFGQMACSL